MSNEPRTPDADGAGFLENKERFFARLTAPPLCVFLAPSDVLDVKTAYILAKFGHRAQQRRDGERYFEHPRRATLVLIDELLVVDPVCIMIGLYHDCPEDTHDIDVVFINHVSGAEVARGVRQLTKLEEHKADYYRWLELLSDFRALLVKFCDRIDNLRSLRNAGCEFAEKQVRQTRAEFMPLVARLREIAPPQHARAAAKAINLFQVALADAEAMLAQPA